jgi:hypothetical protein
MKMTVPRRMTVSGSGIGNGDGEGRPAWAHVSSKNVNAQMESSMGADVIPLSIEDGVGWAYGSAEPSMDT